MLEGDAGSNVQISAQAGVTAVNRKRIGAGYGCVAIKADSTAAGLEGSRSTGALVKVTSRAHKADVLAGADGYAAVGGQALSNGQCASISGSNSTRADSYGRSMSCTDRYRAGRTSA